MLMAESNAYQQLSNLSLAMGDIANRNCRHNPSLSEVESMITETNKEFEKMKTAQQKAVELLPFVQALANGENVTQSIDGGAELPSNGSFVYGLTYSIKPKMMLVNGFEVPEPMRIKPAGGSTYYCPALNVDIFFLDDEWRESHLCTRRLSRGLIHSTKEAAIAHAKAMLWINPNGGE